MLWHAVHLIGPPPRGSTQEQRLKSMVFRRGGVLWSRFKLGMPHSWSTSALGRRDNNVLADAYGLPFTRLLRCMLRWDPRATASAHELLATSEFLVPDGGDVDTDHIDITRQVY